MKRRSERQEKEREREEGKRSDVSLQLRWGPLSASALEVILRRSAAEG